MNKTVCGGHNIPAISVGIFLANREKIVSYVADREQYRCPKDWGLERILPEILVQSPKM